MPQVGEPLPDLEFVLRRVPRRWYDPRKAPPLNIEVFLPMERDLDGLSVYRASDRSVANMAERDGRVFHVLELSVGEFRRFSAAQGVPLSFIADDSEPGHAHIPERRRSVYDAHKPEFKRWARLVVDELARLGTRVGRIVHDAGPADPP